MTDGAKRNERSIHCLESIRFTNKQAEKESVSAVEQGCHASPAVLSQVNLAPSLYSDIM